MASNTTRLPDKVQNQISEALRPVRSERVILFGSYAWGQPTKNSDIGLYIVAQDDFAPATWSEEGDIVRRISNRIFDLRTRYPIDLLVHIRPIYREFVQRASSLSRRVMSQGVRLL